MFVKSAVIYSASIASKRDILASLTAHFDSALDHNYLSDRYHGL